MALPTVFRRCMPVVLIAVFAAPARAADLSSEAVLRAIEQGKRFLLSQRNGDGSWSAGDDRYQVGVTSLALLALINAGMTADNPEVQKGLQFLRNVKEPEPSMTYEISLMIMALAAAKDPNRNDTARILVLAKKLEDSQITNGENAGVWSYNIGGVLALSGDRSNGQYAVLGLHEAAQAGVPVSRQTWERVRSHWEKFQNPDGGWGYSDSHNQNSTGSMTVAGIATLSIVEQNLADDKDVNPDGSVNCCREEEPNKALERGLKWMANHFAAGHNPNSNNWVLYYLYGVERAGRLSGQRFFGEHDWYREGARFLIDNQSPRLGNWRGDGTVENHPVVGTSFALLFLSKGLAPVLINKLQYGPHDPLQPVQIGAAWNRHRHDVRNLTDLVSGLKGWPKLMTWQTLDIAKAERFGGVQDLMQAPVLYITGNESPTFTPGEEELLRQYLNQGGFIFAVASCQSAQFDAGFRDLVKRLLPGEGELKPLPPEHPVYRSEYLLDPNTVMLEGVDYGCRTPIIYIADDVACLWNKWARHDPPKRSPQLKSRITRSTQIGVNVVAYATGREPPKKLDVEARSDEDGVQDAIQRGFLQIAKIRHTGGWDSAPQALRHLLIALNKTVGMAASTKQRDLPLSDATNLKRYPMLYMHGRYAFQLSRQERDNLRQYLERGGVLFADACCGTKPFDRGFRDLMAQVFPEKKLERIPPNHEMFTSAIGQDVRTVRRRTSESDNPNAPLKSSVREVEPFLEGIELDGRYAVIYSKYDISCALERQSSVACEGYVPEDALNLAMNVVLYALLQDVNFSEAMRSR